MQHDYDVANGPGAAVRSDMNTLFAAIVSQNSGATEPTTMFAYQFWADTTTGILKQRNSLNTGWLSLYTIATGAWLGNSATVSVSDAASDTTTWPMLAGLQTGNQAPTTDAGLSYNASTNTLTVAQVAGNAASSTTALNTTNTNGQIPFPSTQIPSADPNTLDDYEEGTFTTSSTGFTTTLTLDFYYVKVGKLVTLTPGLSNAGTTARFGGISADTQNKTLTGVPLHLCPAVSAEFVAAVMDNSVTIGLCNARVLSTGVIYFTKQMSASGEFNGVWTASGSTSIKTPTISYVVA
jgi:hypothetical protein